MKDICRTDFIGFLNRSENSGLKFVLAPADAFLKNVSKEFLIFDIYKKFKKEYKNKM